MSTLIRCYGCRAFFDKQHLECPDCGAPRRGFNKYLRTAALNNNLFQAAESADNDKKLARALKAGHDVPPPKWAMRRARQIVADL